MSWFICPLCSSHHLRLSDMSPTIESAYHAVDELVDDYKCREAYKKLETLEDFIVDKADWHKRCAEVCYMISNMEEKDRSRVEWLKKGRKHALNAHQLNPGSVPVLQILCSTTGRLAEESGVRDKINLGFEFKATAVKKLFEIFYDEELWCFQKALMNKQKCGCTPKSYLDLAVALEPASFELLHMRGRFAYQVANLSFLERLAAKAIGTLPQVSLDAALTDLLEAEQARPGITENQLYLGRVLHAKGDYITAKKWLTQAASAKCDDDESVEREHITAARKLLMTM